MKYVISILAVLSAPLLYGIICVPLVGVLMSLNPDLINDMGGTEDVLLSLQVEVVQLLILVTSGFVVAAIARFKPMMHVMIATGVMMAIGVSVQLSFWDSMLVWHHFVFFACIALGVPAGGLIQGKVMAKTAPVS